MKKLNVLCIILCAFLLTSVICVFADEAPVTEISIDNTEQFLQFAENCRLDSYSKNLSAKLTSDIDLTGHPFSGIPVFCGKLDGNNHTITGITLDYSGSHAGLFRYITETAEILDLNVSGTILPKGSASYVGGIAGSNAGLIQNCTFSGTVSGIDHIGGIAGINTDSGTIQDCSSDGVVYGNHFAGGIVGSNNGMTQNCINFSSVNTELKQNNVDLSDITLDAITGTESAGTITDIGGIAGINSGFISECENRANIGYQHIGYNIGGIAGSQTGYIADCINTGTIFGRKEIGGIVGQLEPVIAITYATDTLQILQGQLQDLSALTDATANHIENAVSGVKNQFVLMRGEIKNAIDVLETLVPEDGSDNPIPSTEDLSKAIDILQNTITSLGGNLENIYKYLENAESSLSRDMDNISNAVSAMQLTLNNASEHLGGSVSDHSDADSENDLTAKIEGCNNSGPVYADLNGGGIAGAIAFENDLDPEADIDILGDMTLNFAGSYRAVITGCENTAPITVKKQYAGGIVGYATLGLVRNSNNTANLICPNAVFVGGIAGRSNGLIRNCNAKCMVSAKKQAGGIAGQAKTVSDCLALSFVSANEKAGMILGSAEDLTLITNNRYMQITPDLGAIDGISYESIAQASSINDFLMISDLPEFFQTYTVTFAFPDGTTEDIMLKTGESLTAEQIPELPVLDGCKGTWNGLDEICFFDATIDSTYESKVQIVQSQQVRENGLPVLLAEGAFQPDFHLEITKLQEGLAPDALEGWSLTNSGISTLRYLPPESHQPGTLCVMIKQTDGSWKQIHHTISGSYLVFDIGSDTDTFCIIAVHNTPWGLYIAAGAVFFSVICVITVVAVKRKKGAKNQIT